MNKPVLISIFALLFSTWVLLTPSSSLFAQQTNNYSFVTAWGSSGSGFGRFSQPLEITTDSAGNVYVTDFTGLANQVQKFTSDGTFLLAWGYLGTGGGGFANALSIAVDNSNSTVYVTDWGNADQAVQKFRSDGAFLELWGSTGL